MPKKIYLPLSIIIASFILGGSFYLIQLKKQGSIEQQQSLDRAEKEKQQEIENERQILLLKQNECESLSTGVMKKWNNVMGVTYSDFWKECVVTYTDLDTGEVRVSPLTSMSTVE